MVSVKKIGRLDDLDKMHGKWLTLGTTKGRQHHTLMIK